MIQRAIPILAVVLLALTALSAGEGSGAWLGVMMGESTSQGVVVRFVIEESPAAEAGLRGRDRLLAVNGAPVANSAELLGLLRAEAPGNWIPITIERAGREREVRVRLGGRPSDLNRVRMRHAWIGVELIDLPPALREHFGAPEEAGAMVSAIRPGSPAESAGFELGDVVYEFDGLPVDSARTLLGLVAGGGVGNKSEFKAARNGVEVLLEAVLERDPESTSGS